MSSQRRGESEGKGKKQKRTEKDASGQKKRELRKSGIEEECDK